MISNRICLLLCALLAPACAATSFGGASVAQSSPWETQTPKSTARVTGIIGVTEITSKGLNLSNSVGEATEEDDSTLPLIAAQVQVPVRNARLEWGYEGGFSLGWKSERNAYVIDTGTVLISADNQAFLFDISGGLYLARMFGGRVRLYGGAGPLMQFGSVDLDLDQAINGDDSLDGSGVGLGYYVRTGFDVQTSPGTLVGLSLRWVDSEVDLGGKLGTLENEALQIGLAVTSGF